ncbi:MAG: diguanylate cyclase [Deltaproteobacteria bacterium]|nr:diguanylate cyclase [Deltaproteobacteria bacterium]
MGSTEQGITGQNLLSLMKGNLDDADLPSQESPPRILLVDDSISVRNLVRGLLVKSMDANIVEAEDGRAALKICLEAEFDCIICDMNMPIMDGMTFLRLLRSHFSRLELPLLFLTVREDTAQKVRGFKSGASDFLAKPFQSEELLARVETQVSLARMHREGRVLTEKLQILVDTDPLTGIGNRRSFVGKMRAEFGRSLRMGHQCALLMIDVDHFKNVNDRFGHPVGDDVLQGLANILTKQAREYDCIGRIGGEEFAVLLPEVSSIDAVNVAGRIRAAVEEARLGPEELGGVTISVGVAIGPLSSVDSEDGLFKRADKLLYDAKNTGRNKVCGEMESERTTPGAKLMV